MSGYVCSACHVLWPCTVVEHDQIWSNRVWQPEQSQESIPCFVLDHDQCTVPMFCRCRCHRRSVLDEPAISVPPSNR